MSSPDGGRRSITPPLCFARLPHELVLDIFEIAACADRATALEVCVLNRDIASVVRPIIYHTVVLSSVSQIDAFLYTLRVADKSFLSRAVKNLFIADGVLELMHRLPDVAVNAMWRMTHECTGIKRVIAPVRYIARLVSRAAEKTDGVLPWADLRHVVLTQTRQLEIQPDFTAPLFRQLTRLYIQSHFYCFLPDAMVVHADSFPHLTHLAVLHLHFSDTANARRSDANLVNRLPGALSLPLLQRLMVCCSGMEMPEGLIKLLGEQQDSRIRVVMGFSSSDDLLKEFVRGDAWWDLGVQVYYGP